MKLRVFRDAQSASDEAAAHIAARARSAANANRRFSLALSGGRSPQAMFAALALADVPWDRVLLFQVDERCVPAESAERNFAAIRDGLLARVPVPRQQVYPMAAAAADLSSAALQYAETLRQALGPDGRLDLVHLGLGADGHTASLVPGDPAIESADDVIVSQPYQGRRRLSLSGPILSSARERLWLVTGVEKRDALAALLDGDLSIPAGRLERAHSIVFADASAAPG